MILVFWIVMQLVLYIPGTGGPRDRTFVILQPIKRLLSLFANLR